jgi:hypothetical protein
MDRKCEVRLVCERRAAANQFRQLPPKLRFRISSVQAFISVANVNQIGIFENAQQ